MDGFDIRLTTFRTGLSRPMLIYLAQQEIVVPTLTPNRRRGRKLIYSLGDVILLRAIARLLEQGVEVKRLKISIRKIQANLNNQMDLIKTVRYMVTDGFDVYLHEEQDILRSVTTGQLGFAFLVNLAQVRDEVERKARTPSSQQRRRPRGYARVQ